MKNSKIYGVLVGISVGMLIGVLGLVLIVNENANFGLYSSVSEEVVSISREIIFNLENEDRATYGLGAFTYNETLEEAAQARAEDMAKKGYFSHTSPDGTPFWHWPLDAGYDFIYIGENLAVKFYSSESVENAWMNSPTHRANILSNKFRETGIGIAKGYYKGVETEFVAQVFGTAMPSFENL